MINNCMCEKCDHMLVCENYSKKIAVFSEEAKKSLGIDITMDKCINFKEAE